MSLLGKTLLSIAFTLGILQGLLILIGGIIAARDANSDLSGQSSADSRNYKLGGRITDEKYYCGDIRVRTAPSNIALSDEECSPDYEEMDRGWFQRVHDICSDSDSRLEYNDTDMCRLKGYECVLGLSISCGSGWIVASVFALLAAILLNHVLGLIAASVFAVFYVIFLVFFVIIWQDVISFNDHCLDKACKGISSYGKKSSYEMLAYCICAAVLICAAIVSSVLGVLGLKDTPVASAPSARVTEGNPSDARLGMEDSRFIEAPMTHREIKQKEGDETKLKSPESKNQGPGRRKQKPEQKKQGPGSKEQTPEGPEPKKQPEESKKKDISTVAEEYFDKFVALNEYIADKEKMQECADKAFEKFDKDKSGKLSVSEFNSFMVEMMVKQKLPAPSESKVEEMLRRYDIDRSRTLEKHELKQLILETLLESRDLLIAEYARKKANSWRPEKVPEEKDVSKLGELDALLQDNIEFFIVLEKIMKELNKSDKQAFNLEEVWEVLGAFCRRYRMPCLRELEITEIMVDMDRDITEYDIYDLRMACYATLIISRGLLK